MDGRITSRGSVGARRSTSRRSFVRFGVGLAICLAFIFGRLYQHTRSGYSYRLVSERHFDTPMSKLVLREYQEHIGLGVLEAQTQALTLERNGATPLTIYESQAGFQESFPQVHSVQTNGNTITWTDGIFEYKLDVKPIDNRTEYEKRKSTGW